MAFANPPLFKYLLLTEYAAAYGMQHVLGLSASPQAFIAQFRADPLPVEQFSLIASFPTKAGSVYEDQADYPLKG